MDDPAAPVTMAWIGHAAALGAAACWVLTAMAFAAAGRRIGASAVNLLRIAAALLILAVVVRVRLGAWLPEVPERSIGLLLASGVLGLAVGDHLLFSALVRVGPRLGTLVATTLAPPLAAALAWPVLGERLAAMQVGSMVLILGGIAWVLAERADGGPGTAGTAAGRRAGLLMAAGGGACQAAGLILSKLGLGHGAAEPVEVDAVLATAVRMAAALPAALLLAAWVRRRRGPAAGGPPLTPRDRRIAVAGLAVGTVFGPVLGVWCSMVAVDHAPAGIAATLMATTPVLILPVSVVIDRERLGSAAIGGAVLAVAGVALLSLG